MRKVVTKDYGKFIQNFNRYKKENRLQVLTELSGSIKDTEVLKPIGPEVGNPPYIIIVTHGGVIIIIYFGPKPRPLPGIGPKACDIVKGIIDKGSKFERFSKGGMQHLVVTSSVGRMEIQAPLSNSKITLK